MDRLVNYAFLLLLIYIFVLNAAGDVRMRIGIAMIAATLFAFLVFAFKWLTLDGAVAASVFGTLIFGLGGWQIAAVVLLFFVTSTILSINRIVVIEEAAQAFAERKRRDGLQVWANGFWMVVWILLWYLIDFFGVRLPMEPFLFSAVGAVATATADTWATELGSTRSGGNTYLVTDLKPVPAGTEGGISVAGTAAAAAGSLVIAAASVIVFDISWMEGVCTVFAPGFLGCMADSYFGATFQRDDRSVGIGSSGSPLRVTLDNNFVNWAATGLGSVLSLITYLSFV
ncbi:MAG: DUF92 domain-containing protein [Balneolaceae bacterium]|nr:DUF92 domain-containing protein [Balneolaceae bacterium]